MIGAFMRSTIGLLIIFFVVVTFGSILISYLSDLINVLSVMV